ncbi:AMIN domain-containing protein [Corallococcus carmarthensis]|uniref:AMIN domain-containing protein n=1 Tax=Corallococcus carmarthensis TaxID=2316728 RepID=UPI00148DA889|nr:AMIN domain-containing protein [Corallococcus carmarthensis]NOK20888.1 AMIN domain-containing protein [Corallococcus carmarthensis]
MKGFVVSLLGLWLVPLVALAQQPADLNTITAISVSGGTVEITGSKKPDFNSFTMTDPPRLVIDVSGAAFQGVAEEQPVGNGTVTGIRTATYGTESASIARILIGYEREVETDIQSSGNKLVVKVLGGGGTAVAQATPTEGQGTAQGATAANTPAGTSAQDAARAAASDRESQEKAVKAAADAARAEREAQEKAAAEATARAKADSDAEAKRQEDARLAAQRQDEERRKSEEAAVAERKRQEAEAQAATKRAEDERRATAQAAADQKRQKEEEAKTAAEEKRAAAQAAADEKRAAAQAAAEERQSAAKTAAEKKRAAAQTAAEQKRLKEEERRAAAQARREEQQSARESAAEEKRQQAAEARERRQQAVAARESRARPSQGSAAAEPRESGGGAVSSRRKTMTLVGFQQQADSSRVFVRTNEPVRYQVSTTGNQVVLELENTRVVESNNTLPLDTHFFPSAVSRVEAFSGAGNSVRVVIQLKQGVRYETRQDGGLITLDFPRPGR